MSCIIKCMLTVSVPPEPKEFSLILTAISSHKRAQVKLQASGFSVVTNKGVFGETIIHAGNAHGSGMFLVGAENELTDLVWLTGAPGNGKLAGFDGPLGLGRR